MSPIDAALAALGQEVEEVEDPAKAVVMAHEHALAWADAAKVLATQRRKAMRQAMRAGLTRNDLAGLLGLSRQRVEQIAQSPEVRPRKRGKGK